MCPCLKKYNYYFKAVIMGPNKRYISYIQWEPQSFCCDFLWCFFPPLFSWHNVHVMLLHIIFQTYTFPFLPLDQKWATEDYTSFGKMTALIS